MFVLHDVWYFARAVPAFQSAYLTLLLEKRRSSSWPKLR